MQIETKLKFHRVTKPPLMCSPISEGFIWAPKPGHSVRNQDSHQICEHWQCFPWRFFHQSIQAIVQFQKTVCMFNSTKFYGRISKWGSACSFRPCMCKTLLWHSECFQQRSNSGTCKQRERASEFVQSFFLSAANHRHLGLQRRLPGQRAWNTIRFQVKQQRKQNH